MKSLLSKNKLRQKLIQLKAEMQVKYPKSCKFLNEKPFLGSAVNNIKTRSVDFAKSFEIFKFQLKHHIENRSK